MSDRIDGRGGSRAPLLPDPSLVIRTGQLRPVLRLIRPHQWVKNVFVAAPLFFTPSALSLGSAALVLAGIAGFSLIASSVYILNDYVDRHADRLHPTKRTRPIASGEVAGTTALLLFAVTLGAGLLLVFGLHPAFGTLAMAYFLVNVAYCFGLKQISIVDVLTITLGFVLRVFAGAMLIAIAPSVWIVICTGLVALFLALAKRRDDIVKELGRRHRQSLDGYNKPFLDTSISVVLGALLVAYMIYTTDGEVAARLGSGQLYLTIPFVIAGILRYLQIVLVEERSGAPTTIVLTDRFLTGCLVLWAASFTLLIHL
jgi:decaprenyl-phosphate phosphoribosyltransferase